MLVMIFHHQHSHNLDLKHILKKNISLSFIFILNTRVKHSHSRKLKCSERYHPWKSVQKNTRFHTTQSKGWGTLSYILYSNYKYIYQYLHCSNVPHPFPQIGLNASSPQMLDLHTNTVVIFLVEASNIYNLQNMGEILSPIIYV